MSTVATVDDLALFMNMVGAIDTDRAQLFLDLAEDLASAVVEPLPDGAKVIVLTAAARAMPNPSGTASQSVAGASASWSGGVYLTRSERLALKRAAGVGAGAFSVNVAPNAGKGYRDPLRFPADQVETFVLDQDLP